MNVSGDSVVIDFTRPTLSVLLRGPNGAERQVDMSGGPVLWRVLELAHQAQAFASELPEVTSE